MERSISGLRRVPRRRWPRIIHQSRRGPWTARATVKSGRSCRRGGANPHEATILTSREGAFQGRSECLGFSPSDRSIQHSATRVRSRPAPRSRRACPLPCPARRLRVDPGTRQQRKRKTEKEIRWKNEEIVESCRGRYPRRSFFFALSFELFLCFWLVSFRTDS